MDVKLVNNVRLQKLNQVNCKEVKFSHYGSEEFKFSHCGSEVQVSSSDSKKVDLVSQGCDKKVGTHCNEGEVVLRCNGKEKVNKLKSKSCHENKCLVKVSGESSKQLKHLESDDLISVQGMVELFEMINSSGLPNFRGSRVPVPASKNFNMDLWRSKLNLYDDKVVCDFLEFGFPLDFNKNSKLDYDVRRNHKGARDFADFIKKYLARESEQMRVVGPFRKNPLSVPLMVSPMNSVPKANDDERRVIVDLSWPHGSSINDGISKDVYLGEIIDLHYASVEDVCQMVLQMGVGSLIYKRDLRRAYRQIPVDPGDYCYLGYCWNEEFYFDTVLCMGQRNAAMACSRVTKAVMHMHENAGHAGTSYLDDLIGVSPADEAVEAYDGLGELLLQLGLFENFVKACPPATIQIVLGVLIDTVNGTISVPSDKMEDINSLLIVWRKKRKTNKVDLQALIGKLQFVSKCVRQSRIFVNRLLETLRSFSSDNIRIKLTDSFKKDIRWWWLFMGEFNGVSFIPPLVWHEPDVTFSTDSCLKGCGGICNREYFHMSYPEHLLSRDLPIHALEMPAVLVAIRFWGKYCVGGKIQIYCDNESVVKVLNSSKTKDDFMGSCLREIWLEVSKCGFEMRAIHLPGVENRVADWLSRWDLHEKYQNYFLNYVGDEADMYVELQVTSNMLEFSGQI